VPFVHGGAELHVRAWSRLTRRGLSRERVSGALQSGIQRELLASTTRGRIELSESNGVSASNGDRDEVPTYFAAIRQKSPGSSIATAAIYDLCGTRTASRSHGSGVGAARVR